MWSDDGQYLAQNVADVLIRALADVNHRRPKDPIGALASALYTIHFIPQEFESSSSKKETSKPPLEEDSPGSGNSKDSTIAGRAVFENENVSSNDLPSTKNKTELIRRYKTDKGETILHFAASKPHDKDVLYRLLNHTREVNLADREIGFLTPREIASENMLHNNILEVDKWVFKLVADGNLQEVKQLILDGYDFLLDIEDEEGHTTFDIAQISGQKKMVELLKWASAFEERRDFLHKAIKVGSLPHAEFMSDSEDIVRAKDSSSRTSLHLAVLCEDKNITEMLAEKYPLLLSIGDNLGRTPLHYAMAVQSVDDMAKVLVQLGAKRTVRDARGKLPSHYFMNRAEIVEMIKTIYQEEEDDNEE